MTHLQEEELVVNVRSPSLHETLAVTTKLNTTVLSLKEAIKPIHPNLPNVEDQRIIYSGKLLQDNELLSDIIKQVNVEVAPTFHLVVKPSLQQTRQVQPQPQTQAGASLDPSSSSSSSNNNINATTMDAFQSQPWTNNFDANNTVPRPTTTSNVLPAYPSLLPGGYQVVAINGQLYLAPVLTPSMPSPSPPIQQQQQNTQFASYPQPAQFQPPQPQQQPIAPMIQPFLVPPQQQQAAAAPARPVIAQRATSLWLALKLVVVLFMLCQGASIERIFLFHAIAFIFFLYQTGRLTLVIRRIRVEDVQNRFNGQPQRPTPAAPTPQAEGASTAVNNNNNLNQRRTQDGEENSSNTDSSTPMTPTTPPTILDVCKRGAYTFVASLWPTYGQDPLIARAFENNNEQREGMEEF